MVGSQDKGRVALKCCHEVRQGKGLTVFAAAPVRHVSLSSGLFVRHHLFLEPLEDSIWEVVRPSELEP